ncbi:uncharacterized protein LOC132260298 [Phlebotomus argentipes]|uniref:uncharacterized protein LOC132260298 n=1 Tax=Phlebotomus argentipes TaxID=94469 RepID=UPI0028936BC9|nr:uncharacterized protein LOC132260298 [Phlebotomus argentipes]XP_059614309.1 uncharacterized protein LOC132260298 [Phlebotomus argentipes]
MFGSKIRSWMENHIGRPKKKGNKNKNGNSGNLAATNTPNGHTKKSSHHQADPSIGSPARRREVSPIQNHATSRVGWQSPQEVAMSPHSDHFGYRQMVKSSSSPRNMPRKSAPPSTYSKSVDEKSMGRVVPSPVPAPSNPFCKHRTNVPELESRRSTIAANLSFVSSTSPFATMSFSTSSASSGASANGEAPAFHRKSIERFKGRLTDKENVGKSTDLEVYPNGCYANPDEEGRYGKILPRRSDDMPLDRYDTANANVHLETCLRGATVKSLPKNGPFSGAMLSAGGLKGTIVEVNRNILRMNQQRCSSSLMPTPANHLAHVINSLSSPESAYSTGYSTDGTSPGASYTPEYYINMRTGTHYFPKGANGMLIESNRYKYSGLNKIDEGGGNSSGCESVVGNHRRTESCHLDRSAPAVSRSVGNQTNYLLRNSLPAAPILSGTSPIPLQKNLTVHGIESPSPRQRCRIRTNPWFSTACQLETAANVHTSNFLNHRIDRDNSSTSSGVKSSASDVGTDEKSDKNKNPIDSSESDSSSSTEIEVSRKTFSPNTIRRRRAELARCDANGVRSVSTQNGGGESDEDATLNEMMGKFDESYVYEKETDILSDSDPTDCCASDLDTGQDAGDECDTDELLEIDFIDTGSIQEIADKDQARNTGSCSYHSFQQEKRSSKVRRSHKHLDDSTSKRRKRFVRTRKKSTDRNHSHSSSLKSAPIIAPRGCRSVGGTPVCLRRNQSEERKAREISPLSNRSNSLTFTEIHSVRSRFLTIAESEKALIKADLEADVKYKQLIHEAETILVSMKSNGLRETPTPSPSRRICNPPPNKRVEMLRNCEADIKRETVKSNCLENQVENIVVNKRLEILRYETASAPNSPKSCRFSPRKTHITNFIQQNVSPTEILRRKNLPEPTEVKQPPKITAKQIFSPPRSPTPVRRRMRSAQMNRVSIDSDSDTDDNSTRKEMNGNCEGVAKKGIKSKLDHVNKNVMVNGREKPPLMSFRSVDIGHRNEIAYCPQSEPLKRKIYTGSASYDKIQKSLDMESEIPKKALLHKISLLRKERQGVTAAPPETIPEAKAKVIDPEEEKSDADNSQKRQLILHTIENLKRSLEDQSIELCGLNDPEEKVLL